MSGATVSANIKVDYEHEQGTWSCSYTPLLLSLWLG